MSFSAQDLFKARQKLRVAVQILSPFSQLNTYMVETEYLGAMNRDGERIGSDRMVKGKSPPWVKVGNLYLSMLEGNDTQWGQLIEQLYRGGQRKFAVFTGRHGDEVGTHVDMPSRKMNAQFTTDANHTAQDTVKQQQLSSKLNGSTIRIEDVGKPSMTLDDTRAKTRFYLWLGYSVIYAWCFSLLSMYEHDASKRISVSVPYDSPQFQTMLRRDGVYQTLVRNKTRTIDEIVRSTYNWVPGSLS